MRLYEKAGFVLRNKLKKTFNKDGQSWKLVEWEMKNPNLREINGNYFQHIAVIPARRNSKSLPFKNRFLFKFTAEFLKDNKLFDKVYVNSDDLHLKSLAQKI